MGSTTVLDAHGKAAKFTTSTWHRGKRESNDGRARIVWNTDFIRVALAMGVSIEELEADLQLQQLAINADTETLGGQVSLSFTEEDWTLTATVVTKSARPSDFVCGKVFVEGNVPDIDGDIDGTAKALLLLQGHAVFETGVGFLTSTSKVNDGKEHVVAIIFNSSEKRLTMQIDGREEATLSVEDGMVGDHAEAFWLTASGVDKPSLQDTPARRYPLTTLVGKVTKLTYNGKNIVNPVHAGKERPPKGYTLACKEGDPDQQAQRSERRICSEAFSTVNGQMPGAFAVQSKVEYFSVTHGQWVLAHVVNYQYVKKGNDDFERLHNLRLKSGTDRLGVTLPLLRSVLRPGEPCSVYSVSRGVWVPAIAARTQLDNPSMWGYRVYYTSDLTQRRGFQVDEGLPGVYFCPVRKAQSTVLRKRFDVGNRVHVWKDQTQSWVYAKVLSIAPVDTSAYFDVGAGEPFCEGRWNRKQELPNLPITVVSPPRNQAPEGSSQQGKTVSTGSAATTVPATPSVLANAAANGDSSPRDMSPRDSARSNQRGRVGLALWEIATVKEENPDSSGATLSYEVETYRLRMQPEDWGKEEQLPPLREELIVLMRNGGIEVPLESTLANVVTQFKEEMVDEAHAVAEKGRKRTKLLTATFAAGLAVRDSESEGEGALEEEEEEEEEEDQSPAAGDQVASIVPRTTSRDDQEEGEGITPEHFGIIVDDDDDDCVSELCV